MKKFLLVSILLYSGLCLSQNNYDVYVIKKEKENPYGAPISLTNMARENAYVQSQLQKRYDYNYERLSNAFNDISNQIYKLNVSKEIKDRIINRWNLHVDNVNSIKINFTRNSEVTDIINFSYNLVNRIIYEETN